jgi:hypothetical protein
MKKLTIDFCLKLHLEFHDAQLIYSFMFFNSRNAFSPTLFLRKHLLALCNSHKLVKTSAVDHHLLALLAGNPDHYASHLDSCRPHRAAAATADLHHLLLVAAVTP